VLRLQDQSARLGVLVNTSNNVDGQQGYALIYHQTNYVANYIRCMSMVYDFLLLCGLKR